MGGGLGQEPGELGESGLSGVAVGVAALRLQSMLWSPRLDLEQKGKNRKENLQAAQRLDSLVVSSPAKVLCTP